VQPSDDVLGLLLLAGLVAAGQALAVEFASQGSVSVSAVGSIAGAAIFGPRAALLLAVACGGSDGPGVPVEGPAVIDEYDSTTVVLPGQRWSTDATGSILIEELGR